MTQYYLIFFIFNIIITTAVALQCPTCSGETCQKSDVPILECNENDGKLTYGYLRNSAKSSKLACASFEYQIQTKVIPVRQCLYFTPTKNVCQDISLSLPPFVKLTKCKYQLSEKFELNIINHLKHEAQQKWTTEQSSTVQSSTEQSSTPTWFTSTDTTMETFTSPTTETTTRWTPTRPTTETTTRWTSTRPTTETTTRWTPTRPTTETTTRWTPTRPTTETTTRWTPTRPTTETTTRWTPTWPTTENTWPTTSNSTNTTTSPTTETPIETTTGSPTGPSTGPRVVIYNKSNKIIYKDKVINNNFNFNFKSYN